MADLGSTTKHLEHVNIFYAFIAIESYVTGLDLERYLGERDFFVYVRRHVFSKMIRHLMSFNGIVIESMRFSQIVQGKCNGRRVQLVQTSP